MAYRIKNYSKRDLNGWRYSFPFVLPGLILISVFVLFPMIFTLRIAFSNYQIVFGDITYVGFDNFRVIFTESNKEFWYAYRNNFLYAIVTVPFIVFGGMIFSYLINNLKKGQSIFRVGFYLPVITSWVIVSLVFKYMFNSSSRGLVNYFLVDVIHVLDDYIPWLLREWSGNLAIWLMGIWKNIGWAMLIYLAALQSIPNSLYEAADLDGATSSQKFRFITIPSLKPTTFFVLVNMIIGSFNVFLQVMLLTSGGPNGKTSVLQYMLYDRAFGKFQFGQASAVGLISSITIVLVTVSLNKFFSLDNQEGK